MFVQMLTVWFLILYTFLCMTQEVKLSRLMTKPTKWHVCPAKRFRSAWASAQSDQSLRCLHEETLGPWLPIERTAKTDQTGQMPRLIWVFAGCTCYFVVFITRRLNWAHYYQGYRHQDRTSSESSQIIEGLDGVYWLENNGHFSILIRE